MPTRRTSSLFAVAILVFTACHAAPPVDPVPCVSVLVGIEHRRGRHTYLGAGTVIGGDDAATYVLTAGHVVTGEGTTRAYLVGDSPDADPAWIKARVLACECTLSVGDVVTGAGDFSGVGDYAILALDGRPLRSTTLSLADPAWDDPARVETFDLDTDWFSSTLGARTAVPLRLRRLGSTNPFVLGVPMQGEIRQGMSGSPVLSGGRLIAMLVAIAESQPHGASRQYAVMIGAPAIAKFLGRNGLDKLVSGQPCAPALVAPPKQTRAPWASPLARAAG